MSQPIHYAYKIGQFTNTGTVPEEEAQAMRAAGFTDAEIREYYSHPSDGKSSYTPPSE